MKLGWRKSVDVEDLLDGGDLFAVAKGEALEQSDLHFDELDEFLPLRTSELGDQFLCMHVNNFREMGA